MTAEELYELVQDLPRECWPDIELSGKRTYPTHWLHAFEVNGDQDQLFIRDAHAAALFVASCLRWLGVQVAAVEIVWCGDVWTVCPTPGELGHEGSTLLHALVAACRAVKG